MNAFECSDFFFTDFSEKTLLIKKNIKLVKIEQIYGLHNILKLVYIEIKEIL